MWRGRSGRCEEASAAATVGSAELLIFWYSGLFLFRTGPIPEELQQQLCAALIKLRPIGKTLESGVAVDLWPPGSNCPGGLARSYHLEELAFFQQLPLENCNRHISPSRSLANSVIFLLACLLADWLTDLPSVSAPVPVSGNRLLTVPFLSLFFFCLVWFGLVCFCFGLPCSHSFCCIVAHVLDSIEASISLMDCDVLHPLPEFWHLTPSKTISNSCFRVFLVLFRSRCFSGYCLVRRLIQGERIFGPAEIQCNWITKT